MDGCRSFASCVLDAVIDALRAYSEDLRRSEDSRAYVFVVFLQLTGTFQLFVDFFFFEALAVHSCIISFVDALETYRVLQYY